MAKPDAAKAKTKPAKRGPAPATRTSIRQYPLATETARTDSNLKDHNALATADEQRIDREINDYRKVQSAFRRQRSGLLTKPAIKQAAEVFKGTRSAFEESLPKVIGRDDAIGKSKQKLQNSMDRSLSRDVASYEDFKALRKEYAAAYSAVAEAHAAKRLRSPIDVRVGDRVDSGIVPIDLFEPPFPVFDVTTIDWDGLLRFNNSFADPASGVVMNNVKFHHDESAWNGYNPILWSYTRSSVGINYHAPRTGFLNIAVVMQNLFNSIDLRVTDNFGFSHANLYVYHEVFGYMLRGGQFTPFEKTVLSPGLISHGVDLHSYGPDIPGSTQYAFSFDVEDALHANEEIQILAGCSIRIDSDLDDMESFVKAMLAWQVQKLYVWIAD